MFYRFKFTSMYSAFFTICAVIVLLGYHSFNVTFHPKTVTQLTRNGIVLNTYDDTLLELTRQTIKIETWKYNFSYSGVDKLEDLVPESGGTPLTTIIASTWRSGSSFLGELINAVPGTFYSFEPLAMFARYSQIREPQHATGAISLLRNLIRCNYKNETVVKEYLDFAKNNSKMGQFKRNQRFWNKCNLTQEVCFDDDFSGRFCKLFPFQTIKLVRIRLALLKDILDDSGLNAKLIFLVRDPRGVMHSRKNIKDFCSPANIADCAEPARLCSDMEIDHKAAADFLRRYPNKIMVIRYEDLALNLDQTAKKMLHFLNLEMTSSVQEFLKSHSSKLIINQYSTFRISKTIPYKWMNASKFSDVQSIQKKCRKAMSLWGYRLAQNASHLTDKKFNPLLPYSVK